MVTDIAQNLNLSRTIAVEVEPCSSLAALCTIISECVYNHQHCAQWRSTAKTHFISFNYAIINKQAAIYPVLQSTQTQVNEMAGYSAIAPQVSKNNSVRAILLKRCTGKDPITFLEAILTDRKQRQKLERFLKI